MIFMGPGSPSYAVRQLEDSLTWEYILARHRLGAGSGFFKRNNSGDQLISPAGV